MVSKLGQRVPSDRFAMVVMVAMRPPYPEQRSERKMILATTMQCLVSARWWVHRLLWVTRPSLVSAVTFVPPMKPFEDLQAESEGKAPFEDLLAESEADAPPLVPRPSTLEDLLGESEVSPSVFEDFLAVSVVSLQVQQVSELHLVESVASQ